MEEHDGITRKRLRTVLAGIIVFVAISVAFIIIGVVNFGQEKAGIIDDFRNTSILIRDSIIDQIQYESFTEIASASDMELDIYKDIQQKLDTVRTATGARYLYTAQEISDGTYVYVVDGLPVDAEDFAVPGTPIEPELFEYMKKSLNGETAISDDFMDTECGTVCIAYFPIDNGSSDVYGVLCMEFDMKRNRDRMQSSVIMYAVGALAASIILSVVAAIFYRYMRKSHEAVQNANDEINRRIEVILGGINGGFAATRDNSEKPYIYVSDAVAAIQGYTVSEFMDVTGGKAINNIYKDDLDNTVAEYERQKTENDTFSLRYHVVHKDGSLRWILNSGRRIVGADGEALNYTLYQDVTDFEEQKRELGNTASILIGILESLSSGIIAYTLPGREPLVVNEEAKRMFGMPSYVDHDVLKEYMEKVVIPDNRNVVYGVSNKLKQYGDEAEYVFKVPHEDGDDIVVQCCTRYLQMADGTDYILSCMLDITERSALDAELRQERSQYRDALTNNSKFFYSFDVTEGLIYQNFILKDGTSPLKDLGIEFPAHFDEINRRWIAKHNPRFYASGMEHMLTQSEMIKQFESGNTRVEVEYRDVDTDTYTRLTILLTRDVDSGHILGFTVANDITDIRREEEHKKRALIEAKSALEDAYEAANRASFAKTGFLSRMSHDIRTPMNAIVGMTAIASTHMDDPKRVADCLDKITVSSKYLLGLINEVLDMSRIESGKFDLNENDFNISTLIEELLTMCRPQVAAKGHTLTVNNYGIEHENVIGDSQRIQQCFMNLMSNAIKYTPGGGRIMFSMAEKQTNKPNIGCYEFVFEDNGIGMSDEFKKHLFEPFSRDDDARVQKIQGTGLGMAITRNIVNMMNGRIDIDSEQGRGTKVTMTVFLKFQNEAKSMGDAGDTADTGKPVTVDDFSKEKFDGGRVLLVEDNEINSEIAGEILNMAGLTVDFARDGKEAVDIMSRVEDGYYNIVFMDIQMPVMNGYDATRAIRALAGDYPKNVPIIAMTANAFAEDVREALGAGMNEHITKPIDFNQLLKVLKKRL